MRKSWIVPDKWDLPYPGFTMTYGAVVSQYSRSFRHCCGVVEVGSLESEEFLEDWFAVVLAELRQHHPYRGLAVLTVNTEQLRSRNLRRMLDDVGFKFLYKFRNPGSGCIVHMYALVNVRK